MNLPQATGIKTVIEGAKEEKLKKDGKTLRICIKTKQYTVLIIPCNTNTCNINTTTTYIHIYIHSLTPPQI